MKAIDFAVSQALPPDLRQPTYDLSKKGVSQLLGQVAAKYPERYAEVSAKISNLGRHAVWNMGYTVTPKDTRDVIDVKSITDKMDVELAQLRRRKDRMTDDEYTDARNTIYGHYSDLIEKETMREALRARNSFAIGVASGARGNPAHIKAILATPALYTDSVGRVVPLFVRNSFSKGLRPAESLAGTYGARSAVTATKRATAKGGDFLKILTQNTLHYNVTENKCGSSNGIDLPPDDPSLTGRVLAREVGPFAAGTVVDRRVAAELRKIGKPVIVRSAMTCRAKHGLCAHCVGVSADGKFPRIGESVGVTAGDAIGEPIVQGALNCLAERTLVRMADFSVKEIQQIKPGDMVLGADVLGNTFPVRVLALHDQGMQPMQTYNYLAGSANVSVTCTSIHELLQTEHQDADSAEFRKRPAGTQTYEPFAVVFNLAKEAVELAKRAQATDAGVTPAWDISVEHPDELFVLANGIIVSNTKHNSGMAKGKRSFSGFDYVSQFVQVPEDFKDRAAVSELDGTVDRIETAPQGGKYVVVAGQKHFVLPGFEPTVKPGDRVEAGDVLSDGLASPADIVRLRGLGEGREYYRSRLGQILADSGNPPERRNMEIIARAAVDNYVVEDPDEDSPWLPDDAVREQEFLNGYKPPADTATKAATAAVGGYLQTPVLHYTVGTRVTPKIAEHMTRVGVKEIPVSNSAPTFRAEMPRLRTASHTSRDWLQSLSTSYLASQMQQALERGDETNVKENYHYAPRLAFGADLGSGGFGENIERTGKF